MPKTNSASRISRGKKVGQKSYAIVIPAEIVKELNIRERQKLVFKVDRKKIIISDFK